MQQQWTSLVLQWLPKDIEYERVYSINNGNIKIAFVVSFTCFND